MSDSLLLAKLAEQRSPSALRFTIGCLATFRLALLVSEEDGPAFLFRKLRRLPPPGSSAKKGLSCPWCMSIWAGALVAAFEWWRGNVPGKDAVLYGLGLSAGAIAVHQQFIADR